MKWSPNGQWMLGRMLQRYVGWLPSYWLWLELPDTIKNRELAYELVEEVNACIDKMESIENDEVEANDYEELDENELKFEIDEEKVESMKVMSTLNETFICTIFVDYTVLK